MSYSERRVTKVRRDTPRTLAAWVWFADVARPPVPLEQREGLGAEARSLAAARLHGGLGEKRHGELLDLPHALPQRWDLQAEAVEAKVEILPETPRGDLLL